MNHRDYAVFQLTGTRDLQADVAAVSTAPNGVRAYALLDGIGETAAVRAWTRSTARRLARTAARRGSAVQGLRAVYEGLAAERFSAGPHRLERFPSAAALVVVTVPGQPTTLAWSGDCRAYAIERGTMTQLTEDHNRRRAFGPRGNRNAITSFLGCPRSDEEVRYLFGHPAIETAVHDSTHFRLLLSTDGAYEPYAECGRSMADMLTGMSMALKFSP